MGDGIKAYTAYDANGNIKAMQQYGLTMKGPEVIDALSYTYSVKEILLKSTQNRMA